MPKPQPLTLGLPQSNLECALGNIKAAAKLYEQRGHADKASRLKQHAEELASLRDPEVVAFYERRRHRRARAERPSV